MGRGEREYGHVVGLGVILAAGVLAYANSLWGVFVFDDVPGILRNPHIDTVWPPWRSGTSPFRSVVAWTFALNHALHGFAPMGYHVLNVAIHLAAAAALYGSLYTLLRVTPALVRWRERAQPVATAAALLWCVHPITTQAVTYISQRIESLMGLFYLATVFCVLRGIAVPGRERRWHVAAVLCAALGMCTKRVMFTVPLMLLLIDALYLAPSLRELARRRGRLYLALAATVLLPYALAPLVPEARGLVATAGGTDLGVSRGTYLLTQGAVVLHYLQLCVWPADLCFDYGWPPAAGPAAWPPAVATGLLVAATVGALGLRHPAGLAGAWFFGILAPTSSVFPIDDLAVEHRVYLPAAAVCAALVLMLDAASARTTGPRRARVFAGVIAIAALVLTARTHMRNRVYHDPVRLWADVARQRPDHARGHAALAEARAAAGDRAGAREAYLRAEALLPDVSHIVYTADTPGTLSLSERHALTLYLRIQRSLAALAAADGTVDEAIAYTRRALARYPDFGPAQLDLAWWLAVAPDPRVRDAREARALAGAVHAAGRDDVRVHEVLAAAAAAAGDWHAAVLHLDDALARTTAGATRMREVLRERRAHYAAQADAAR